MADGTVIGLTPDQLTSRVFRYSSGPSMRLLAPRIVFRPDGSISGHQHQNEVTWRIEDGQLVLFTVEGRRSCIFTTRDASQPRLSLSGKFLLSGDDIENHLDELQPPSSRTRDLPNTVRFEGEFGEEVNNFIPFVHWLHRTGELAGRKIETYAGMEPFYFFLEPGQLVLRNQARQFQWPGATPSYYLHPNGVEADQVGMEWVPDYRSQYATNFGYKKPLLVIHNKYSVEWGKSPVNYLELGTLDQLFNALKERYQIIFFEAARNADSERGYSVDHQTLISYSDVEVARKHPEVIIFGDMLRRSSDSYNLLKLKIFSSCYHFITVQGGNAHMCAWFPGSLVAIQHVVGPEEWHAYPRGTFQFFANPRPTYLIGRNGAAMLEISKAFEDCVKVHDRVHLGPEGIALYERFNAHAWQSVPVSESVEMKSSGVVANLRTELYDGDDPLAYADTRYIDHGYPHTNLQPDLIASVLDTIKPRFWLELGSMLGGSAIRAAEVIKSHGATTEIVCIDPFTGDVNMWAWERPKKVASEWQFLRLERGRPTIYDRFLANVMAAGHADIIMPIVATSIVGIKLLRRLVDEQRLGILPSVIYLDSAHEPDETLLELQNCWNLLEPGGVLMGDDWEWAQVRNDVIRFVQMVQIDSSGSQRLAERHKHFTEQNNILLDRGQWVLVKPSMT